MAILKFELTGGGSLNPAIDAIFDEIPNFADTNQQVLKLTHESGSIIGASEPNYISIDLKLPNLSEETINEIKPLIAMIRAFIAKLSGSGVAAQIVFYPGTDDEKTFELE